MYSLISSEEERYSRNGKENSYMTGAEIVSEIVSILTSGITTFAKAIGSGIADCASAFAFSGTGESQTLSVFMVLVLVFAGVSLCMGLTRLVFNWLSSLGAN